MAKTINLIRIANAKLVSANINTLGVTFAAQSPYRADGFLKVNVTVANANPTQKMFLEGADFTIYAIGGNVTKLSAYSLSMFKKLEQVWLFSSTMVEIEETDNNAYLDYLKSSCVIYVPSNLISNYQTVYSNLSSKFAPINLDYTLTIVGSGTLTSEIITDQLMNGTYNAQDRGSCTKLVISGFDNYMDTLWGYSFSQVLPNLNNNIWYNANEIDFTTRELEGVDELLESDITNLINGISSDKLSGVTQLKFSGFSDMSVALTYNYSDLPNLAYVWLDNVRYEKLQAPSGYEWVEYVENDNNCGFEMTTTLSNNSEIELEYYDNLTFSNSGMIFNSQNNIIAIGTIAATWEVCSWNINPSRVRGKLIRNNKYKLSVSKNGVYANSSKIIDVSEQTFEYTNISLFLFGTSQYWFPLNNVTYGYGKLYNFVKKENGVLDLDLRPVKNLNTSEYCIYDLISNTIYSKSGSGVMTGGSKANQWNIPTYFYPIADLVQEYDARLTQTFYLNYNSTLPSYADYQLTYYTDINCTTSILPENMQSGTRYYVKAVMVTLTIQGSGTLTSAIVEPQVAKAGNGVTKVIVPVDFTSYASGSITAIQNGGLTNLRYLETTYEGGAMEIDFQDNMWQEIITKIESLGSTLENELIASRPESVTTIATIKIAPPRLYTDIFMGDNIVYIDKIRTPITNNVLRYIPNLICAKNILFTNNNSNVSQIILFNIGPHYNSRPLKSCTFDFSLIEESNQPTIYCENNYVGNYLDNFEFTELKNNIKLVHNSIPSYYVNLSRQAYISLANSLGTPSTQKTLTIGATNLAKLTAEDVAIVTAKNWQLA